MISDQGEFSSFNTVVEAGTVEFKPCVPTTTIRDGQNQARAVDALRIAPVEQLLPSRRE